MSDLLRFCKGFNPKPINKAKTNSPTPKAHTMNSKHLKLLIAFIALLILANIGIQFWHPNTAPQANQKSRPASPKTTLPAPKQYSQTPFDWHSVKLASNLWKISKAGQPDSYLLGTIHIGKANAQISPALAQLISQSQKIITEVPADIPESTQQSLAQAMISDTPLTQKMGKRAFTALQQHIRSYPNAEPIAQNLDHLHPWAVFLTTLSLREANESNETGVDNLITAQAIAQHKPRGSLESHIEALAYFHVLPEELIIAGLNDWVQHPKKDDDKIIAAAYAQGNFAQIPALLQKDTEFDPESSLSQAQQQQLADWFVQQLIIARNRNWLPKIQAETAKQPTLFAVGTAHLVGNQGLIMLLRNNGYQVEPMPKLAVWQ